MKKRHETIASTLVHPVTTTSAPQRLKHLSETNEEDEGLVQLVLQKRKIIVLVALPQKGLRKSN